MPRTTGDINAAPYAAADLVPGGSVGALLPATASMAGLTCLIVALLLLTAVPQHRPRHTVYGRAGSTSVPILTSVLAASNRITAACGPQA